MKKFIIPALLAITAALFSAGPGFCAGPALSKGQTLYVPAYSHVYQGTKTKPFNLTVTLSIRNIDLAKSLRVDSVDYYDSEGKLVRKFLEKAVTIGPLGTIEYIVGEKDTEGGSGANFIVRWQAEGPMNAPIVEAVMIGTYANQGISFLTEAREVKE